MHNSYNLDLIWAGGILNPRLLDEKIPFPYIKDHMILETFASSHKYAFFRDWTLSDTAAESELRAVPDSAESELRAVLDSAESDGELCQTVLSQIWELC